MTTHSHLQIHIRPFGMDVTAPMPMAFPVEITLDDLKQVAATMLEDGKVREAKVVNTSSGAVLFEGRWTLTTEPNGTRA